jgi:anti-anti-sigma regulatory factor
MPEKIKPADQLLVSIVEETAYVRVKLRGSFKISPALKEFGQAAIEHGVHNIVFDMTECVGMDSTFMGVVAGLAFRLKRGSKGQIIMVNLTPRTRGLLATLGLDQLVQAYMAGCTPARYEKILAEGKRESETAAKPASRQETAELMLEAHENLVELTPGNLPKFKDVLAFLKEDIQRGKED